MKRSRRTCKIVGICVMCLVVMEFVLTNVFKGHMRNLSSESSIPSISYRDFLKIPGEETNWRREARVFEVPPHSQRFLTIGIPTVRREKSAYFFDTLDSLINCTGNENIKDIVFVVFLADFNRTWKAEIALEIHSRYTHLIENGTIHVIQSNEDFYPQLDNLKHTFNDSEARTKWRSKQNVDYAFLWLYSKHLSQFYMQIEDDVFTIPGYLSVIKQFISEQKDDWSCLEFSLMGFIGKTFHSKDLDLLAKTILLFYDKQPVDFLFQYFNLLNLQPKRIIRRPTLFRHVGLHSSLPGKTMEAIDKYFDNMEKTLKGDNPPAKLYTTLKVSNDFPLINAYSLEDGYFWAYSSPREHDSISIVFVDPQRISKISILTGSREHKTDILEHGRLDACVNIQEVTSGELKCNNSIKLGSFSEGAFTVENIEKLTEYKISGLKIIVEKDQGFWLIIKEIAVFVSI